MPRLLLVYLFYFIICENLGRHTVSLCREAQNASQTIANPMNTVSGAVPLFELGMYAVLYGLDVVVDSSLFNPFGQSDCYQERSASIN